MESILQQDRFFLDGETILWMYHNPDAVSGDQFVSNWFGLDLLKEASHDPSTAFEYIAENCRQYLTDVGEEAYEQDKKVFYGEPFAIGMTDETLKKLLRHFMNGYFVGGKLDGVKMAIDKIAEEYGNGRFRDKNHLMPYVDGYCPPMIDGKEIIRYEDQETYDILSV